MKTITREWIDDMLMGKLRMDGIFDGVTMKFFLLVEDFKSVATLEDVVSKLVEPYQAIQEQYEVRMKNRILWGAIYDTNAALVINVSGSPPMLEKALEDLFKAYGFPSSIYKPNHFFSESDTENGIETARNTILKMGGKIKKRIFPYFGYFDDKYFVSKKV